MNQNVTGYAFIVLALAMLASNMSDSVADLKQWHDAATPIFVAVLLKQAASVVFGVLGGKMTTQFGADK